MLEGKSIHELATELQRRQQLKKDYLVPTEQLYMEPDAHHLTLPTGRTNDALPNHTTTNITDHTHSQLASWANIPKRYYDRMRADEQSRALLAVNMNHWFRAQPAKRMLRTMDGTARAFLSDRYRRIDNEQIAEAALQPMLDMRDRGELIVKSCDVTDSKLYMQVVFPRLEDEVKVGDAVQGGLIISNSEVGAGSLDIRPILYRLICNNGMVVPKDIDTARMRRAHLGRKTEASEDYSLYADETVKADDHALMLKIRDTIQALADPARFQEIMASMKEAASSSLVTNPSHAVEALSEELQIPESRHTPILESLIRGGDYSRWGMANAITAQAHSAEDYDTAVELEELGGRIITLAPSQWEKVAVAA